MINLKGIESMTAPIKFWNEENSLIRTVKREYRATMAEENLIGC